MKKLFGYKIVRKDLTSITRDRWTGGVEYKVNIFVSHRRGFGPLAVFDTRKMAIDFAHHSLIKPWKIYKVRYTKSYSDYLWDHYCQLTDVPFGTLFASSVMLLKRCHLRGCK